jgi:IclR family transcriptional regulator, pca regulon regulatory protein
MAGRGRGPDFVEALARGLDILASFGADHRSMSLSEVASAAGLARPTARRLLLTLEELGYVRSGDGTFQLTPKVMNLGMAYVSALGLWEIARPHLESLVARTGESSSMAQLDGSDIVYVARVSVPKLIALRVEIGTHFPAGQTSQGKVLLAALPADQVAGPTARRAVRGPGPRLGAGRRGTRARRPLGRRPGPGRDRGRPGRDERHRARGRDDHAAAAARLSAAVADHGRRD